VEGLLPPSENLIAVNNNNNVSVVYVTVRYNVKVNTVTLQGIKAYGTVEL
jgi:hypothetical protein